MKPALLDTDTVSYYLKNHSVVVSKVDTYLQQYGFISISIITYYEVMNGLLYKDANRQLDRFNQFVDLNQLVPLDQAITLTAAKTYADLRKAGKVIGHNDILIGATALENDLTMVTNNANHFGRIPNLTMDNWTGT